uniref:Uncharacterized protein n=1 Tax=Trichuris muris TaxID=70415 RepID=A0A5S6QK85_TRIMR
MKSYIISSLAALLIAQLSAIGSARRPAFHQEARPAKLPSSPTAGHSHRPPLKPPKDPLFCAADLCRRWKCKEPNDKYNAANTLSDVSDYTVCVEACMEDMIELWSNYFGENAEEEGEVEVQE